MEYRTHLYVHISIHIYKEEDKIQQTIHKCKLRRHTNKKTLDVPEVQHFGRHFFGGGQQSTTRSNNESERMWNAVSFCLICCRYFFLVFWVGDYFFRLRVPPVQQEKIWKKNVFFSAFRWTNFLANFQGRKKLSFESICCDNIFGCVWGVDTVQF